MAFGVEVLRGFENNWGSARRKQTSQWDEPLPDIMADFGKLV